MTIVSSLLVVVVDAAAGLGSMSSIAVSYGENGPAFCGLKTDGSHLATCYGSNSAITQATPPRMPFLGLTGGDGFVCGLLKDIRMGVPRPMPPGAEYGEIAAGDYHLCGLRKAERRRGVSVVACWGYNMTRTFVFESVRRKVFDEIPQRDVVLTENRRFSDRVQVHGGLSDSVAIGRILKKNFDSVHLRLGFSPNRWVLLSMCAGKQNPALSKCLYRVL